MNRYIPRAIYNRPHSSKEVLLSSSPSHYGCSTLPFALCKNYSTVKSFIYYETRQLFHTKHTNSNAPSNSQKFTSESNHIFQTKNKSEQKLIFAHFFEYCYLEIRKSCYRSRRHHQQPINLPHREKTQLQAPILVKQNRQFSFRQD